MAYTGGISFKGDRKQFHKALPEALKLANMVSAMKTSAGLDAFEKVYDIEGGTVRVVDNKYTQHLYIDVEQPTKPEEIPEEDAEILKDSTYGIFPTYKTLWSVAGGAPSTKAAAVTPTNEGITYVADQDYLRYIHFYNNSFPQYLACSACDWVGEDGIRLTTHFTSQTNKYSMSWGDRNLGVIRHRGDSVISVGSAQSIIGMGILGNRFIYLYITSTDFTEEATPEAGWATVTIRSAPYTWTEATKDFVLSSGTTVGTFSQARTEYGLAENAGFSKRSYQNTQSGFWYNVPGDAERSYHAQAGSLWFNFSPDGSKAVRCRVFPQLSGEYVYNHSFMEELTFTNTDGVISYVRTITAHPAGATYRTTTTSSSYNNSDDTFVPGVSQPEGTINLITDIGSDSSRTTTITSDPLVIAHDYDTANELVTLSIEVLNATAVWTSVYRLTGNATATYSVDPGPGPNLTYRRVIVGTSSTSTDIYDDVDFTTNLLYTRGGKLTKIPYYYGSTTFNQSESGSRSYSEVMTSYLGGTIESESETVSSSVTRGGNMQTNYFDITVGSGMSDLDLRYGWFVMSDCMESSDWNGSGSSEEVLFPFITSSSATYNVTRQDKLFIAGGEIAGAINLPRVTPEVNPPVYSLTNMSSSGAKYPQRSYDPELEPLSWMMLETLLGAPHRDPYQSRSVYSGAANPWKSSLWAWGLVRGAGGTMAMNATGSAAMFSIQGSDFDFGRGNALTWTDVLSTNSSGWNRHICQLNRFPLCQQAVFHYDAEEGTILNVTDELWPALEYVFVQFDLKDDGVNTYRLEYNNYGLVNLIDFVNVGAEP